MGTRHIVEVIKDGKKIIRQYGQWDGNAETAGTRIRDFIKNNGKDRLVEILKYTEIKNVDSSFKDESDEPDYERLEEIARYIDEVRHPGLYYQGDIDFYLGIIPAVIDKYGFEDTAYCYMYSRNTGYRILDVINILACHENCWRTKEYKIPVYLINEEVDPERKIIVNLDEDSLTFEYFGREKSWNFGKLPTIAELKKIDKW